MEISGQWEKREKEMGLLHFLWARGLEGGE
jgi:hypothetical protein